LSDRQLVRPELLATSTTDALPSHDSYQFAFIIPHVQRDGLPGADSPSTFRWRWHEKGHGLPLHLSERAEPPQDSLNDYSATARCWHWWVVWHGGAKFSERTSQGCACSNLKKWSFHYSTWGTFLANCVVPDDVADRGNCARAV